MYLIYRGIELGIRIYSRNAFANVLQNINHSTLDLLFVRTK